MILNGTLIFILVLFFFFFVHLWICTRYTCFPYFLSDIGSVILIHCRTVAGIGAVDLCFCTKHGLLELQALLIVGFVCHWLQTLVRSKKFAVCVFCSALGTDLGMQIEEGLLMEKIEVFSLFPLLSLRTRWDHTLSIWLFNFTCSIQEMEGWKLWRTVFLCLQVQSLKQPEHQMSITLLLWIRKWNKTIYMSQIRYSFLLNLQQICSIFIYPIFRPLT